MQMVDVTSTGLRVLDMWFSRRLDLLDNLWGGAIFCSHGGLVGSRGHAVALPLSVRPSFQARQKKTTVRRTRWAH